VEDNSQKSINQEDFFEPLFEPTIKAEDVEDNALPTKGVLSLATLKY